MRDGACNSTDYGCEWMNGERRMKVILQITISTLLNASQLLQHRPSVSVAFDLSLSPLNALSFFVCLFVFTPNGADRLRRALTSVAH